MFGSVDWVTKTYPYHGSLASSELLKAWREGRKRWRKIRPSHLESAIFISSCYQSSWFSSQDVHFHQQLLVPWLSVLLQRLATPFLDISSACSASSAGTSRMQVLSSTSATSSDSFLFSLYLSCSWLFSHLSQAVIIFLHLKIYIHLRTDHFYFSFLIYFFQISNNWINSRNFVLYQLILSILLSIFIHRLWMS